ncbi:nuclear pore glycoprotein p62 [Ephemerocybe angulata]|uniref:Nucleoporin NSP1 n=1 Tax=Ephemerocybe angulata TaxID=980116 RepID=A0A8H6IEG4_9AGAR|nr:nuclear pore glycoprotein p62 [Tulosesus angulatus]
MNFFNNPPATSANTGGNPFGNSNANNASTANTGGGLFGQPAKPAGGLFGNTTTSTTGGGLFGGGATTSTPAATTGTPGGLFGGGAASTAPATSSGTGGGLFGGGSGGGGLFGAAPAANTNNTASTPAASTNPLFGGFGAKPADSNSTTAPKPASSFFGAPPAATATSTTTTPAPAGGLFGAPKPADTTTGTNAASTAPGGLFAPKATDGTAGGPAATSSNLFNVKAAAPTATTSTAPSPFTLGLGANKDAGTSTAAPSGGLFGGKPAEKKDGAAPAAPAPFNLGGALTNAATKDGDNKPAGTAASTSANPVVAVPPPSMLRGKTIEEIVNRWTSDLETHVKDFSKFAGEVAVWDRALIENGNNLAALYSHVLAAERQQNEIDQTLDHVEQQQKELLSTLDAYEKVSQDILGGQGGSLRSLDTGPADTERDKNYMLATDLHTNLDDLSASLTQMIDSVNALSTSQKPANDGAEDPMAQISQVLSSHLESLQWIDTAARELEGKVNEVERRVKESGHSSGNGPKSRGGFGLNR